MLRHLFRKIVVFAITGWIARRFSRHHAVPVRSQRARRHRVRHA
jgi:hypothetical protein